MPLFICEKCGAIENTAVGSYWQTIYKPGDIPALCSECAFGKWHGKFKKVNYKDLSIEELKNMGILNIDKFIKL